MLVIAEAEYIDGIKRLHAQLDSACKDAYQTAKKYILLPEATSDLVLNQHVFRIFVDFAEEQPENAVKGYFVFGFNIIRFARIVLDYAVLFPVCDHSRQDNKENRKGITYAEIIEMKRNRNKVLLKFSPKEDSRVNYPLYVAEYRTFSSLSRFDDIGKPFCSFDDIKSLKVIDLPENLRKVSYTLVGKHYYAPYSTNKEIYCVLFAQSNNEHDEKAIKVLRWFPKSRTEAVNERNEVEKINAELQRQENVLNRIPEFMSAIDPRISTLQKTKAKIQELKEIITNKNSHGDIFFELGYIARDENCELHRFMIDNSSRLLFGKIENDRISLLGGIKIFYNNDFNFPASLINIPII